MAEILSCEVDTKYNKKWHRAVESFNSGDKAGALYLFKSLANEGCSPALAEIGNIYEIGGGGVERDISQSIKWYKKSAEKCDDPAAHLALGRIYIQHGKTNDEFRDAYAHLSLFEDTQVMGAFYGIGLIYEFGLGVSKDRKKAISYYEKASQLGHVLAEKNMNRIRYAENPIRKKLELLKAFWKIVIIALKDPADPRIGIHYLTQD